jgi:hypothetical protein
MVMGNHIHIIIVVEDPERVPVFYGYLKRELASAINHLLGRRKHTVWAEGTDSPTILDPAKAIERIVYCYTNPQCANLVTSIEEYPQFSTWEMFQAGGGESSARRITRDSIPALPRRALTIEQQQALARELEENAGEEFTLRIEPDAWMECFAELEGTDPEQINGEIVRRVRAEERRLVMSRVSPAIGARALAAEDIRKPHSPKKHGKRMICLSSLRELRIRFIEMYKSKSDQARLAIRAWKYENCRAGPPPGFFLPSGFLHGNCLFNLQQLA